MTKTSHSTARSPLEHNHCPLRPMCGRRVRRTDVCGAHTRDTGAFTHSHDGVGCSSLLRAVLGFAVLLCGLTLSGAAAAQSADLGRMLENLKAADFRVRTQAALALGATKNPRAAQPLCRVLTDTNTTVRAAAAAALGRLGPSNTACLESRLELEPQAMVRSAIEKALELIAVEPVMTQSTRFYVAVAKVSDKSGRAGRELEKLVRKGVESASAELETVALAPVWDSPSRAKQRLAKRPDLKAYFLSPRLPPLQYEGGALVVRLEVAMFSYPEKALIGNYTVRLTQPDVSQGDTASENELVQMAAERALMKFIKLAPTL
ncbi:MAG TPA: HEAT repeat domain-containing protein [Polyangiaceae bacterium]|nr:HEAT repeat domain-containing protein [Polyangiaceae bacterium]